MEKQEKKQSRYFPNAIKATWINIWIASSEKWFDPDHLHGTRIYFKDTKRSIDWDDMEQARQHLMQIRNAGIDMVLFDLTNGFHDFILERSKKAGRICRELGLKFAFAAGNAEDGGFEERAKITWEDFCGEKAEFRDIYFQDGGKPLLILYVVREQYKRLSARSTGYLSRFRTGWASGEDPDKDKWGWQLTPSLGAVPSENVMYLTSSLRWDHTIPENWHKSISFLDYNFLKARQAQPRIMIVGSFDDVCERNSWMPVDTSDAAEYYQQKNIDGDADPLFYYQRVCDWLSEKGPKTVPGGILPDGAYWFGDEQTGNAIRAIGGEDRTDAPLILGGKEEALINLIWLYHLGEGRYRILRLCTGKSLEARAGTLIQADDKNITAQQWKLLPEKERFMLQNVGTGEYLYAAGKDMLLAEKKKQAWSIRPQITIGG